MSTVPDDYGCPDGSLHTMVNLINEGGSIRPIEIPAVHSSLPTLYKILYIHKVADTDLYILQNKSTNKLFFSTKENLSINPSAINYDSGVQITAVNPSIISNGNILTIRHDDGLTYLIRKDNTYKYLGNKLPEIDIRFDPGNNLPLGYQYSEESGGSDNTLFQINFGETINIGTDENMSRFLTAVQAEIAKAISGLKDKSYADKGEGNEYFTFPVFVRYAIRLYDGTLVSHSNPVLLRPNFRSIHVIHELNVFNPQETYPISSFQLFMSAYGIKLQYLSDTISDNFKDLVESIDIYISSELYNIDMDMKVTKTNQHQYLTNINLKDQSPAPHLNLGFGLDGDFLPAGKVYFTLDAKQSFIDDIKTNSLFYKIASFNVGEIRAKSTSVNLTIESDILKTLTSQEVMTDDFRTHCQLYPEGIFSYNNRANIFNVKTKLFSGFTPKLFGYEASNSVGITKAIVKVKKSDGSIATVISESEGSYYLNPYFFYPERTAESLTLYYKNGSSYYAETVQLKPHKFLNGAYYLIENFGLSSLPVSSERTDEETENDLISKNQIKVSEVNNPFMFPATGSVTVGNGTVLGLASSSHALSQGQFGQFPLHAFTSEGVWALEVSETGTYRSKQPSTRDVISDASSLTQIDGGVVFASDKGIMLLQGTNSSCLTDILDGDKSTAYSLDQIEAVLTALQSQTYNYSDVSIKSFLSGCGIAYDYNHDRLIVYNPTKDFSFVYSLKWKVWSLMAISFSDAINDYPNCYVRWGDNIMDLSGEQTNAVSKGLMITRPIKLDSPDILKTVTDIVHRGIFNNKVKSALYGSVDGYNFYLVASSTTKEIRSIHGSPYKYFILVIGTSFVAGESLDGTSIMFDAKRNNRLR